jgi:NAD(P)-dependent dehydrogenase (short-subunit alcohol dehydrogenase family)
MLLENRVAIVTGGAAGMGKAIALKFAGEGCSVVLADVSVAEGTKTAESISQGGRGVFIHCDVTDNQQILDMVNKTIAQFGKVDILVNNAGGVSKGGGFIEDISEEQWVKSLNLNLTSQFLCCKAVVPHMKARKYGKIINLSSLGALHPPTPILPYHSAKGGVLGLTNNLAFELAPYNICVNSILPALVRTEFFNEIKQEAAERNAFFADMAARVPMKRIGTPDDVAGVALFLASELSAYVTGESISVSGGVHLSTCDVTHTRND